MQIINAVGNGIAKLLKSLAGFSNINTISVGVMYVLLVTVSIFLETKFSRAKATAGLALQFSSYNMKRLSDIGEYLE